jgi:hypothetical protein
MSKLVYCLPCGTRRKDVPATTERDGDPMCFGCAKMHDAPLPPAERIKTILCRRGCGKSPHRGRCAGEKVRSAAADAAKVVSRMPEPRAVAALAAQGKAMLKGRTIPLAEIPDSGVRVTGRIGELWETLMSLPAGTAWEEPCATAKQAAMTDRHMKIKARKRGVTIISKRIGTRYFCARPLEGK